jgi:hypothetical protein
VIPQELTGLTMLRELYVNNNLLKVIPSLTTLSNLRVLSLSYNWIHTVTSELPWRSLRCLYLDKNYFRELPVEFRQLSMCQNLRLDWFRYTQFMMAKLGTLDLSFHCTSRSRGMKVSSKPCSTR